MEFKSMEWHKANALKSEELSLKICNKLGITKDDLRQLCLPKH